MVKKKENKCCYRVFSEEEYENMERKAYEKFKNKRNTNSFINKSELTERNRNYRIIDNGGNPFKVIINNKGIFIHNLINYINQNKEEAYKFSEKPILKITKFLGYWYGIDTGPIGWNKNSLLIQITKKKYVAIGYEIISFETDEVIIDYTSYMGNNDVPHPVAFGKNKIYLMRYGLEIKKDLLDIEVNIANSVDIYMEYYEDTTKKSLFKKVKGYKLIVPRQ